MQQEEMSSEAAFHRANELLGQGNFKEACAELSAARDEAKRNGDASTAAFYSSVLGSFLASKRRDKEALESYLDAEASDPKELTHQIRTARFLLNEPVLDIEGALKRIATVADQSTDPQLRDDAADCVAAIVQRAEETSDSRSAQRAQALLQRLRG